MRLLGISAFVLFVLGLMLSATHFWGLSQQPKAFEHAWFELPRPWRILSLDLAQHAQEGDFLWMDVLRSRERNLYAVPTGLDATRDWSDQEPQDQGFSELGAALKQFAGRNLVLNLLSNVEGIDLQISDLVGTEGKGRIMIQSEYDVLMRSIKRLQPLWLFGSSQGERVRFRTFESLWILPATPFEGDVYVGPFMQKGIELLTPKVVTELKRRQKKWIVGPLRSRQEYDLALRLGADGVFIDQEELLVLISGL